MRANPHVRRVNQDWGERIKRVRVDIDQDKARALGISSRQIKAALQGSLSGTTHHAVPRGRQGHRRGRAPDRSPSAPT